jgi:hypothetical protein
VALFGSIFAHRLTDDVASRLGPAAAAQIDKAGGNLDPSRLGDLPAPVRAAFEHAVAYATSGLFWWAVPVAVLVPVLAILIKEVPLRSSMAPTAEPAPADPTKPDPAATDRAALGEVDPSDEPAKIA